MTHQNILHIKLRLILFFLLSCIHFSGMAQEKLYLKGAKDDMLVKIISMSDYKIRYKEWPGTEFMPYIDAYKPRIIKIVFLNGNTMRFNDDEWYCADHIYGEKGFALKFDLLPMVNNTYFMSSEWNFKKGLNFEIGAGYINWKDPVPEYFNDRLEAKGLILRAGFKVIKAIDNHAFNGIYFKPEITYISHINKDSNYIWTPTSSKKEINETHYTGFGTFVNFGYQFSFKEILLFDVYTGLGIAAKTGKNISGRPSWNHLDSDVSGNYGYIVFTSYNGTPSLALQAGFKIGILLPRTNPNK